MRTESAIREKLQQSFAFEILDVVNESHQHAVPKDSETHFRLLLVSPEFDGVGRLQRHRRLNELLADELASGVHALTMDLWTPAEWERHERRPSLSPRCLGGDRGRQK